MLPLVSIVIPVYNVEKFVEEAIQSVLAQTYPHIELILIDDGSTDNSAVICKQYTTNPKVQLFSQPNQGVSVARNNGMAKAQGEFIFCMDSDDTIDANFIQSSVEVALQSDADITVVGEYFERRFPNVAVLPTCAMFVKNSFLDKNPDIRYPKGIQPCEDGLFSHQLLVMTDKIGFNPKGIYHYRTHENQNHRTSLQQTEKILNDIPKWLEILYNFYTEKKLFEQKSLYLALFLEFEPFQRYCKMPFTEVQKKQLFELIRHFYRENISSHISKEEKKKLGAPFQFFLKAENHQKFDAFYEDYVRLVHSQQKIFQKIIKIKLFLVKFIPFRKIRKQLRDNYRFQMRNRPEL